MSTLSRILEPSRVISSLHRHPRVSYQELLTVDAQVTQLVQTIRPLVAFGEATYEGVLALLDWDHRLPSRTVILRIYAYYSAEALEAGMAEYEARLAEITEKERFPEFDAPDFVGLSSDEAYEAEVDPQGNAAELRLVSPWRREMGAHDARVATRIARKSQQFREVLEEVKDDRPDYLGDLEVVAWTPPCETGFDNWTVDVWYLTHLDATVGKGRSFLVDLEQDKVMGTREFMVRAG